MLHQAACTLRFQGKGRHGKGASLQMRLEQKSRRVFGQPNHIHIVARDRALRCFIRTRCLAARPSKAISMLLMRCLCPALSSPEHMKMGAVGRENRAICWGSGVPAREYIGTQIYEVYPVQSAALLLHGVVALQRPAIDRVWRLHNY